ncbi:MAG: class I SAM-dependent methyltransferase [Opitutaceae bacterium]|nr:class I SAM-dependent methyltransferase [Cytophagales bacterium]
MSIVGKAFIKILESFPHVRMLRQRIEEYESYLSFPPGHYYSPIVEPQDYLDNLNKEDSKPKETPVDINFNEEEQLTMLKKFEAYYPEFPFFENASSHRFILDNSFFTYSDAFGLYNMMREKSPKRIVEIGSGFSSALMLDINERLFNNAIDFTFIDPNPERLRAQLREGEPVNIIVKKIQDVDLKIFKDLNEGDFLMIDTSHVSKSGSDVNHIYFKIFPLLKKGVIIHIHDIFFPFEYPEQWILKENRSWNELFLLRSFLSFNQAFKIIYFNSYLEKKFETRFKEKMPLVLKTNHTVCGGIWIEKLN